MDKNNKNPAIRFKGFTEDWRDKTIEEVLTEKKRPIHLEDIEDYQLVTVKRRNEGVISRGCLQGKNILVKNYFQVKAGDYIISKRQVVHGANGLIPEKLNNAVVSNEYLIASSNESITTEYWALISKLPQIHKKFFLSSYGVDIEKLVFDVNDWKKRNIIIPELTEQKSIISFFQNLDNLITLQQNKYDKLLVLKKAMLVKMFPQKGAVVPEIRFKGFTKNWEELPFGDFAIVKRGLTYNPKNVSDKGVKVLRSSNIYEDTFVQKKDDVYVTENAINIDFAKEKDILITSANGSSRLVGKHAVIEDLISKTVHGGFMLIARSEKPYFLNASMSSSWYKIFININVLGGNGAIGNLKSSDLEKQIFLIPKDDDEQMKIGIYFQKLDKIINLHQTQLDKLSNIKKACFTKMFVAQD